MPVFDGDFNSFLFEFVPSVTNADFRLYKQVGNSFNQIAVLSAAEGEIFNIGDIPEYLNYAGYVIDWDKVLNLYGEGVYALNDEIRDILEIRTFYEDIWLKEGKTIKYIKFQVATVS